jgi:phosphoribosylanthranilate isomerase
VALVKICGLTNLDDAVAAADAGADFLGFIFYPPSPRSVAAATARSIVSTLRSRDGCPTLVGVFVNESAAAMADVLERVGLDLAQLSGEETPNLIGDPHSPLFGRSYKALRPGSLVEAEAEAEWFLPPQVAPHHPALLLDAHHPTLRGGTGVLTDWSLAAEMARQIPQLMLAGGLTPDNVAAAVTAVAPFAVDVASGVESSPGRKEHEAVRAFVAAAHGGA